jgi:hypothetical protein
MSLKRKPKTKEERLWTMELQLSYIIVQLMIIAILLAAILVQMKTS